LGAERFRGISAAVDLGAPLEDQLGGSVASGGAGHVFNDQSRRLIRVVVTNSDHAQHFSRAKVNRVAGPPVRHGSIELFAAQPASRLRAPA
jgi:hypothetical protein